MNPLLFTDPAFLFCFLPVVCAAYFAVPRPWRTGFVLTASLALYTWGEGKNVGTLLASIGINYACGLWIAALPGRARKRALILGITANLLLLAVFKYPAFIVSNFNAVAGLIGLHGFSVPKVGLPVGLSFFTFMAISYLADIYQRRTEPETSPFIFGTYLSMFPHLIAGPIVRFQDIAAQLHARTLSLADVNEGIRRFVIGLGKKVLIGNTVAVSADAIFGLPQEQLSTPLAWIGMLCYTIQIYFDFSGYSDMAIGLARMLGFHFPENFHYPYMSQSITEFWRRWHISLSTWLRDYLYLPLGAGGGSRSLNTLIVFLLCGLWHGAAWHFVVWGLYHGVFRVLERTAFRRYLEASPAVIRHGYALLVIMFGWVLFRAETLAGAGSYLAALSGLGNAPLADPAIARYLPLDVLLALGAGIVGSFSPEVWRPRLAPAAEFAALACIFIVSLAAASAGTYNPFIYFRF